MRRGAGLARLAHATLRTPPDLVIAPPARRAGLPASADRPAAVVCGRSGRLPPPTAVDAPTAALLRALRQPGRLPSRLAGARGGCATAVARLVCDGLLEAAAEDDFLSGPTAFVAFDLAAPAVVSGRSRGRLSRDAIRYAARLELDDIPELAARLYRYNTMPLSRRWEAELVPRDLLEPIERALAHREWRRERLGVGSYWAAWSRGRGTPRCKLYVSPACPALSDAVERLAAAALTLRAWSLKAGGQRAAWMRPDKIVLYYESRSSLLADARRLRRALRGIPAHGVPFTAQLTSSGLLSWGADPPRGDRVPWAAGQASWRGHIAAVLARALVVARTASCAMTPEDFARARLALEGVDPVTYLPSHFEWTSLPRS